MIQPVKDLMLQHSSALNDWLVRTLQEYAAPFRGPITAAKLRRRGIKLNVCEWQVAGGGRHYVYTLKQKDEQLGQQMDVTLRFTTPQDERE